MAAAAALPQRVAGDLALDLANTVSWRGTPRERDHLADAGAVLAWAGEAGLVEPGFAIPAEGQEGFLRGIHDLRDAVIAAGGAIAQGEAPPPPAMAAIRDLAAGCLARASLAGAPARLGFREGPDRILGPLAWAAFDLLRGAELPRLKRCPAGDCRWLFIDRTKNASRRWCDMATCGNRAKRSGRRAGG